MASACTVAAQAPSWDIVLVGGVGALARDKLLPGLLEIVIADGLSAASRIIAVDRVELDREAFRGQVHAWLHLDVARRSDRRRAAAWPAFHAMLDYLQGDLTTPRVYLELAHRLRPYRPRLFHLAVGPDLVAAAVAGLDNVGFGDAGSVIVVEKPFGSVPRVLQAELLFASEGRHA